jgi:hypothetical protein
LKNAKLQDIDVVAIGTFDDTNPVVSTIIIMKIATVSVAGLLTAATVTSQTVIEQNLQACLEDGQFEIGVDYFPEKYMPTEYAPLFLPADQASLDNTTDFLTIEYFDYYKIVTNKWHNKSYLLYQCGTEPPIEEVNSGRHHLVLPIPHKGYVSWSFGSVMVF